MSVNQRVDGRLALLGTALLLVAACGGHKTTPPAVNETTVEAELARAERLEVPRVIELFGVVEAEKTAAVSTRVMAMVTAVAVRTGDAVVKGQSLLTIDPQAAEGQLSQARGALAQANAGLALAERNHERFKALAAVDAASELELDMARMQYEQAVGAVEQAEGAVAAAGSVAADSRVVAPFSGRVTRKMVEVGDLAAPGRPLLMLESEAGQRLALTVPESVMARAGLTIGQPLTVRIDTRSDLGSIEATVVEMTPGADPASHSFGVQVALPTPGIPSGASARAWIETDKRTIVAVPETAVLRRGGLSLVVVRNSEGRAGSRVVTIGEPLSEGRVEVLSGLAGGETVLLHLSSVPATGARVEGVGNNEQAPERES
ncbi:MAG: efflux RND transporter periplasmic adaptor subunit [Acidobacteriota bacterium]|nr:efflux RND transporter periplasmic adaptor subunit [Acidobacteriota bacterium]